MKTKLFIMLFSLMISELCGQEEATVWYFGNHAGLDFISGSPEVLNNGAMYAEAGCSVISDQEGKLRFYTNGKTVWNREHQQMLNGFGLNGSQLLNQNSIITQSPDSDHIYYLFTINANFDSVGLNYSIIDMRLDNGLGDVTLKNQLLSKGLVEKITAARHCNGKDIWIVVHDRQNGYLSYLITSDSLQHSPVISNSPNHVKGDIGYLKMSPASNRIAMPVNNGNILVELSRFHNRSGKVYNPLKIFARDNNIYAYGIEFSPDGNLLYLTTGGKAYKLWQYDITLKSEEAVNNSAFLIAEGNHFAMQLAIDGRIYIAKENRNYLSAIQHPNNKGYKCEYDEYAIPLGGNYSLMGLPNFLPYVFYTPSFSTAGTCIGDTTFFSFPQYENSDSLSWNFGDGSPGIYTQSSAETRHFYKSDGQFNIQLIDYHCGVADTIVQALQINQPPEIELGNDTSICNSCSLVLDGGYGMDYWIWQDGSESQHFDVWDDGLYSVIVGKNGCKNADSILITKGSVNVLMPNAFTPNNDGMNDFLLPLSNDRLSGYYFTVFNRWGNKLFETNDPEKGWDGSANGKLCNGGVYNWKLVYSTSDNGNQKSETKIGTVLLLR